MFAMPKLVARIEFFSGLFERYVTACGCSWLSFHSDITHMDGKHGPAGDLCLLNTPCGTASSALSALLRGDCDGPSSAFASFLDSFHINNQIDFAVTSFDGKHSHSFDNDVALASLAFNLSIVRAARRGACFFLHSRQVVVRHSSCYRVTPSTDHSRSFVVYVCWVPPFRGPSDTLNRLAHDDDIGFSACFPSHLSGIVHELRTAPIRDRLYLYNVHNLMVAVANGESLVWLAFSA